MSSNPDEMRTEEFPDLTETETRIKTDEAEAGED